MTLDNSLINDTFMYPYAMEYNAPLTPVYNFNYSCNNNNSRMVSSWVIFKILIKCNFKSRNPKIRVYVLGDNNKT